MIKTSNRPNEHRFAPGSIVAVDTEGSGLYADDGARVSVVSAAWWSPTGELCSLALPFGQGPAENLLDKPVTESPVAWHQLLSLLSTGRLVMHNAAHDLPQLKAGTMSGYLGKHLADQLAWDTMVAQKHLDPLTRVGLEDSCVRRLGLKPWKSQLDRWLKKTHKRFDLIPWSVIEPYATEDAINTLLLYDDQQARIAAGEGFTDILNREMEITRTLYWMEQRGVRFDAPTCWQAAHELEQRIKETVKRLPLELQPPTPHKICAYYYDKLGYNPTKYDKATESFVRSADEYSRRGLADQGAPYIDVLDEWSELETALTMWYQTWPSRIGPDGRLRMRVRQTRVSSGRFSGERVNLLAIPHDTQLPDGLPTVRSMIRPADGKRLWEIDLSQAEVRVGAVAAKSVPMMDEYRKGEGADVYARTALEVFNIDRDHAEFSHYRGLCKRIVLSTLYAAGPATLCVTVKKFMGIDLALDDADRFLTRFRNTYPEFKRCERYWMRYVERNDFVPLALGERRYFQGYEQKYKALNQRIQGSVAVGMKVCMCEVERAFPGTMLLQTHDSLLLELPEDDTTTTPAVAGIMENRFTDIFHLPFIAEVKEWH